jgi:pimeloyl-ACP methyl ester carboxylesterase
MAPPPGLLLAEARSSWASTSDADPNRISLAVVRTLASVQRIAVATSAAGGDKAHRLARSTDYMAGSFFVTLMLEHASSNASSAAFREETSSYIASVMKDGRAASSFLSTSGNAKRLFQALDRDRVLSERVWESMKDIDDIYVRLVSEKDFDVVVSNLGRYRQNEDKRRISLRMFRWWCRHSDFQFRDKDILKAIECMSTAANAVTTHDESSKFDIVRSMRYMIEHMNTEFEHRRHHTLPWLWPLLCFAADGVGSRDWDLVNESLDAFTACIEQGVLPTAHMIQSSALPLLFTMSRDVPVGRLDVGVRIAECVGVLARSKLFVSAGQREQWAKLLVSWLVRLDPRKEDLLITANSTKLIEAKALSESLVDALASLAAMDDDQDNMQIAHLWLSDMIVHLSRMSTAYSDVEADVGVKTKNGGQGDALSWTSAAWWWSWVPYTSVKGRVDDVKGNELKGADGGASERDGGGDGDGRTASPRIEPMGPLPSDPELAMYINASPIGPVYARYIARRLLEVSGNVATHIENTDLENMSPLTAASYSAAAATVNRQVADDVMAQALKVISALASGSSDNRRWLLLAGLPRLLQLFIQSRTDEPAMGTKLERQVSRLLSLLSMEIDGASSLVRNDFIPWLQAMASSEDCKVSSNAAKALLHVEAARESGLLLDISSDSGGRNERNVLQSTREIGNGRQTHRNLLEPSRVRASMLRNPDDKPDDVPIAMQESSEVNHHFGYELMTLDLNKKRDMFAKQKRADTLWRSLRETRLVLHDGIHLMCPLAEHHEALAQRGSHTDSTEGGPEMDIVFIHGIRGGAFITWRQEQAFARGGARGNVDHSVCWPAAWLAPLFPTARLITAEYAAPATWWEGESLPLDGMVNNMAERLAAAGVGSRPVVFVCHSMGGLVVKEIIGRGTERDAPQSMRLISKAAAGAVFYSVPHAGSRLADVGWKLRYLGASPSRAVANLKTDPHLHDETNDIIRGLCKRDKLRVLSFSEGLPTKLSYKVYTHVVPHESAYPGYGDFRVLDEKDHISVCKPKSVEDPAFTTLVDFLRTIPTDSSLPSA